MLNFLGPRDAAIVLGNAGRCVLIYSKTSAWVTGWLAGVMISFGIAVDRFAALKWQGAGLPSQPLALISTDRFLLR